MIQRLLRIGRNLICWKKRPDRAESFSASICRDLLKKKTCDCLKCWLKGDKTRD